MLGDDRRLHLEFIYLIFIYLYAGTSYRFQVHALLGHLLVKIVKGSDDVIKLICKIMGFIDKSRENKMKNAPLLKISQLNPFKIGLGCISR